MSDSLPSEPRPSGLGATVLLGGALALLGLLTSLPYFLGPIAGAVAVVAAARLRTRPGGRAGPLALGLVLGVLGTLSALAPPVASAELIAGFAALGVLLWIASDPSRGAGALRQAVPIVAIAGLAFAVALALAVGLPTVPYGLGIAGGLAAIAVLLVGFALVAARSGSDRGAATA